MTGPALKVITVAGTLTLGDPPGNAPTCAECRKTPASVELQLPSRNVPPARPIPTIGRRKPQLVSVEVEPPPLRVCVPCLAALVAQARRR
jgi:hypothetical protein